MGEPDPDAVDYYSRIGVGPDADSETIERKRKQADRRFSPMSTSPDADERRHMQINAASSVLEDSDARRRYDTFYETFGRIEGTAVYETLADGVVAAIVDERRLLAHLAGFVEVLGPVDGARAFQEYFQRLDPPIPEEFEDLDLPAGYSVEDEGFGVAAWSFRVADEPCSFDTWLSGGRDLWRTAIEDPDDVESAVERLTESHEQVSETPTTMLEDAEDEDSGEIPSEYLREEETATGRRWPSVELGTPTRRFGRVLSYMGLTSLWATGSTVAAGAVGTASLAAAVAVFVPLLALGLVVRASFPGLDAAVRSGAGVPLADPTAPLATVSLVHYLAMGVMVGVATGLSAWTFSALHDRRTRGLPRDAWLVFVVTLAALAVTLFAGVGAGALSPESAVAATGLVTAVTFQAAMDVGAPRVLARLCHSVAVAAYGLAGALVSLVAAEAVLSRVAPDLADTTYAALLARIPLVEQPLTSLGNLELVVVGFGALALVPLVLTTLYSLAYALESAAIRWRSDPRGS